MINKEEIMNKKEEFEKLAKKHSLSVILLYGSAVNGVTISESDLDFAVKSNNELDFSTLYHIEQDIIEFMQFSKVQVIDLEMASDNFLAEILPESVPLFIQNELAFSAFKIYIWKLNAESRWLRDMNYSQLKRTILGMA